MSPITKARRDAEHRQRDELVDYGRALMAERGRPAEDFDALLSGYVDDLLVRMAHCPSAHLRKVYAVAILLLIDG